jgi:hypothetical protein
MSSNFKLWYNFMSPVTGRILADEGYVLLGDSLGVAIPSPILIDIQLDLNHIRQDYNILRQADFVVGFPNEQLPNCQVLSASSDGFMFNNQGIVITNELIPIESLGNLTHTFLLTGDVNDRPIQVQTIVFDNFPNVTYKKILRGDANNRLVESDDLTDVENSLGNVLSTISSILSALSALEGLVNGLEQGLAEIGGWAAIALLQAQMIAVYVTLGIHGSDIADLKDAVNDINSLITAINTRIDNLSVTLVGDVTGSGDLSSSITTTLQLTLDEIKVAENTVNLNNQRITNLKDTISDTSDAMSYELLQALIELRAEETWQV